MSGYRVRSVTCAFRPTLRHRLSVLPRNVLAYSLSLRCVHLLQTVNYFSWFTCVGDGGGGGGVGVCVCVFVGVCVCVWEGGGVSVCVCVCS